MWRLTAIAAVVAAALAVTAPSEGADDAYGSPVFWCGVTTTGLPGGTVNHRLAVYGFRTDPSTSMTVYNVWGFNLTTNADSYGYGHTSGGSSFPISMSWTDGPTGGSPLVRQWRLDAQPNFTASARVTDVNTTGTSTTTAVSSLQCDLVP